MRLLTKIVMWCLVFLTSLQETPFTYQHKTTLLRKDKRGEGMKFSSEGIDLLKHIERYSKKPYLDSGGHASIGYGHKIKKGELFTSCSEPSAELLLRNDIIPIEKLINSRLNTIITQNQFDALVIFIYNIGTSAFLKSDVYQHLKNQQYEEATKTWAKWVNVSETMKSNIVGKTIKRLIPVRGLINRRAVEIELFNA